MDVEPCVPPGKQTFCPFRAEKLLADKIGQDLAAEDLSQPRVVDPGDLMEEARLVHSALGHQEMEVGVKIDPIAECLNSCDDSGHNVSFSHDFEIPRQGAEGAVAVVFSRRPC